MPQTPSNHTNDQSNERAARQVDGSGISAERQRTARRSDSQTSEPGTDRVRRRAARPADGSSARRVRRRVARPAAEAGAERTPERVEQPAQAKGRSGARKHVTERSEDAPQQRRRNSSQGTDKRASSRPNRQARRRGLTDEQRAQVRKIGRYRHIGVLATGALLALGAFVGLLFFARPTTSTVERRNLATFPAFTLESFLDGSYTSDIALWYSDTYPLREAMVRADQAIDTLHGIKTDTQMVGTAKQADELPPKEEAKPKEDASQEKKERKQVEVPTAEEMAAAVQDQIVNGLYVKGDAAYSIYYFSQEAVQEYADAINTAAEELEGQTEVYSIVVPNSSGILLPEDEVNSLGGTNQVDAIDYFYSLYNDNVHSVDTVTPLKEHASEYLFYRTDHHWTALGAYYGYQAFCKVKGITPENKDDLTYANYGDFLGSYYTELGSAEMEANPDYVEAWIPNGTNALTLYEDGTESQLEVITDTTDWPITEKTMCFIMGDQQLEKIENPNITDGSSCMVVKDSFGDFLVPWLVDHYQTVWVADFRYFPGNIKDFCFENDVKDLIIESNISLAGGGAFGPAILGRL